MLFRGNIFVSRHIIPEQLYFQLIVLRPYCSDSYWYWVDSWAQAVLRQYLRVETLFRNNIIFIWLTWGQIVPDSFWYWVVYRLFRVNIFVSRHNIPEECYFPGRLFRTHFDIELSIGCSGTTSTGRDTMFRKNDIFIWLPWGQTVPDSFWYWVEYMLFRDNIYWSRHNVPEQYYLFRTHFDSELSTGCFGATSLCRDTLFGNNDIFIW